MMEPKAKTSYYTMILAVPFVDFLDQEYIVMFVMSYVYFYNFPKLL